MTFKLKILPQNTSPPIMDALATLTINSSEISILELPSIEDPDDDGYAIKVNLGTSKGFGRYQ